MTQNVPDHQLWSWIDREDPQLQAYLDSHPEEQSRVERLRAQAHRLEAALETPCQGADAQGLEHEAARPKISGFVLRRPLGKGGMGVVYEALQAFPKRIVALKCMHRGLLPDEERVKYFQREVEALARLVHPGIARVYEAGRSDGGDLWFSMELVSGRPLDQTVDASWPRRRRLELFCEICDAVDHAHGQGVIHRDLKPLNILVDGEDHPKVLDFGLARILAPDRRASLTHLETGRVLGTLAYMSPEQARGAVAAVDARSDGYALGVLLYELVSGELPYRLPASLPESLRVICEDTPRRLRAADSSLRGDLETIVEKALAKEPERRYATVAELACDVRRHLAHKPIRARPPGRLYRLRKFMVRNRRGVALALVAALVAAAAIAVSSGGLDLFSPLTGQGYEKLSPFEQVEFEGDVPIVRVRGTWYELLGIDGIRTPLIIEYCRQTTPYWQKRFSEDLVEVLSRMGHEPADTVTLRVVDRSSGKEVTIQDVAMTEEKRNEVYRTRERPPEEGAYAQEAPFSEVRWEDGRPMALIESRWLGLVSLDGVPVEDVLSFCRETWPDKWRKRFSEDLVEVLTRMQKPPGKTVRLLVEDLDTGRTSVVAAPMTEENRQSVWRANQSRKAVPIR